MQSSKTPIDTSHVGYRRRLCGAAGARASPIIEKHLVYTSDTRHNVDTSLTDYLSRIYSQ